MTYPTQWEYMVAMLTGKFQEALNKAGADGWELVGITGTGPQGIQCVMKRPKPLIETDTSQAPRDLQRGTIRT